MTMRSLLERLVPRTLAAQVLCVLLGGIVLAHIASFTYFHFERAREVNRLAALEIATRIAEMAGTRAPPATATGTREGPPWARRRFRWNEVESLGEPPAGGSEPPAHLVSELRRLLAQSLGQDPVAWTTSRPLDAAEWMPPMMRHLRGNPPPGAPHAHDAPSMRVLTVGLRLPDGRKAIVEAPHAEPSMRIPTEAWLSIGLVFLVTAGFSIWAVRLAVRPVKVLAGAAERLSRNLDAPSLGEKGANELRMASRAFNRMQDRLRRHVNTRALAFAAMSHDMRTPLTRMRLRLEMLDSPERDKLARDVDEIEALVKTGLQAVRDLAAEEAPASVDVNALLSSIAQDASLMGRELRIEGSAAPIEARPVALGRALANLVDNAFKYGRDVSVAVRDSGAEVSIAVRDRGPGLPPEEIPRVASPFYRVESSRSRETGGTGLGLAIAKDIVEGHGGELGIANRDGGGLEVTVRLPR